MWRQLRLILWKNLVIRKRHWLLTLAEILIPVTLFTLVAYARSVVKGLNKIHVDEPTFNEVRDIHDIYSHLDVGELNLWYAPYTDFTESIIQKVQHKLQIRGDAVREFTSKSELLTYFEQNHTSLVGAIMFNGNDQQNLNYDLTMYDKYFVWNTDKLFRSMFSFEDGRPSNYIYKGYVALQTAIDLSYIEILKKTDINVSFSLQEFPLPPRTVDSGLNELFMYFLPLITIFSFMFLCPAVLKRVGEEKSSGTKEFMKMVGLKSSVIWLGWFLHAMITNLLSIAVIIILMKVPFWGVSYPPIEYSDGTVLFTFLFLYCMASITFCFLFACLFNTPSIATVMGILAWIFSYFIPQTFVTSQESLSWRFKILFAFFPNMALYYGYTSISVYEMREIGVQWYNIFKPGSGADDDITMGNVILMLTFDIIVFMLLTLYIENVKPGEYGIAKPYSFPFTNLQEFAKRCFTRRVENTPENTSLRTEDVEPGKIPCIQIFHLKKKYANHVAVEDLNMDIYKNHITVLLGQNGAGKTTTMSILTGMINATDGCVKINGKDIKKDTYAVRKQMGLCPQHNLLFPDLTVLEHLEFFAKLKCSENPIGDAKEMTKLLGIGDKNNDMANVLSGGMKRKLCLGMALIGNSQVLVLDEPTSGMDPESRRKIWNLLLEYRKSKTILITTHFMEEADVLGDFIAIMANGRLQCFGTPMQLKTKYNTGYHLCLLLRSKHCIEDITRAVKQHFSEATILRESEDSVVYILPLVKNGNYKNLIEDLEKNLKDWDIISINIKLTTLDDVFLKAKHEIDGNCEDEIDAPPDQDFDVRTIQTTTRMMNNLSALMRKRYYFLKKKYYWFIPAVIVTYVIFLLAIWLSLSDNSSNAGGPSINFTLGIYGKPKVYYGGSSSSDPFINNMREIYSQSVLQQGGEPVLETDVSQGIITEGSSNVVFYKRHMIVAAEFNTTTEQSGYAINALYSPEAEHSIPITINLAMNTLLKALLGESFSIATSNTPLKALHTESTPTQLSVIDVASVWVILIPISMFFFMSNFIVFPHTEVSTNFMQIQTIAGVKTYFYWLTNVLFDLIFSILPVIILFSCLCILNWLLYDGTAFQGMEIWVFVVIIMTYIFVSLPFIYLLSYRKTITGGFTVLLMMGIFGGIIPALVVIGMEFSHDRYKDIALYLKPVFLLISPQFGLSYVILKFSKKYVENFNWEHTDKNLLCLAEPNPCCFGTTTSFCSKYQSYFSNASWGIQDELLMMIFAFVLYFLLLIFLNTETFEKMIHHIKYFYCIFLDNKSSSNTTGEQNEENEPQNHSKDGHTLVVKNLTKTFGTKQIVKNLKFQLKRNKCFGLLGVNGAGKSTTFRMLTKYLFFDKGNITVESKPQPITIKQAEYCEKIGYCPQEDCLNYYLTGRELLRTMAYVRGYSDADKITEHLLKSFGLVEYADKPCSEYSGGNKRKLSTCLAFLGSPEVILLDEPTSGVDPASRRQFWKVLSSFKQLKNTSFLLCSHSMEECENLCDEIAIMKDGEIKDQGTLLALKNKYQKGFKITMKLKNGTNKIEEIKESATKKLNATLSDEYAETLTFQVKDIYSLSRLFSTLEALKDDYSEDIEDCVINQISLEDIFLTVAEENV